MPEASNKRWLAEMWRSEVADTPAAEVSATAAALKRFYASAAEEAERRFTGLKRGLPCSRFLCAAIDMIASRLRECLDEEGSGLCWAAAGGFGRGLMSPGSVTRVVLLYTPESPDVPKAVAARLSEVLPTVLPRSVVTLHTIPEAAVLMSRNAMQALALMETRLLGGSKALYGEFRKAVVVEFLIPAWGLFGEQVLAESLAGRDPHTGSPYRTELNLKETAGCLRDVGALQKLADSLLQVPDLAPFWKGLGGPQSGILLPPERRFLGKALSFLVAVRNQLHFSLGPDSDVLQMRVQRQVAEALGYRDGQTADAATRLMQKLFGFTGGVARVLGRVQERFAHIRAVAWERPRALARRELEQGFAEVEGKVYNAASPPFAGGPASRRMIAAFVLSQRRHQPLSQELLDEIADHLALVDEHFRGDRRAADLFMDLLGGSVGVAQRLSWMRDCGLLERYIPELAPLLNLVRYAESSDYTVGEHTLEALRVIDELAHTRQEGELAQREILSQVQRPDLLRLALLLHHVGADVQQGNHVAVERVGRRMGLPRSEVETVGFLVRERGLMTRLADGHDLEDQAVWQRAAQQVGSAERLRMLYLLTYADCRAVGRLGWFSWRDALLYEAYQRLLAVLVPTAAARATPEYFRAQLLQRAAETGLTELAQRLVSNAPGRYMVEVSPEEALDHLRLLGRLRAAAGAMSVSREGGCARVWFCTSDVPARFSQIAGVLTAHGLNILSARAFTLADGAILDRFIVHGVKQPVGLEPAFWQQVENTFLASITGTLDLDALIAERLSRREREQALAPRRGVTSIHFDNDSSPRFTIVDVVTWDRLGLLYAISRALSRKGANIESAMVSTRLDLAQDVFYVNECKTGEKITAQARLEDIRRELLAAAEGT